MNSLLVKARIFWPCLIGRKLNSLKSGEVIQVVIVYGVVLIHGVVLVHGVDLIGVDEEQAGPTEMGSKAVQVVIVDGEQAGLP